MTAEASIVRNLGCAVAVGGGTSLGAARMAQRLVDDGATALISFGFAGGLDPALPPGALVVPQRVLSHGRSLPCDAALSAALGGQPIACLLGSDSIVTAAADKRRLWQETGAGVVDMESGVVAEVATASGIPFAVVRAVCDPATRGLPAAALTALDPNGRVAKMRMAGILARHPGQIPALIILGRDAALARKALIRGAESLGRLAAREANSGGLGL
jgi:adenosylhomocysteine nucleosidase